MNFISQKYRYAKPKKSAANVKRLVIFLKRKGVYGRFLTYDKFSNANGHCIFNFRWGKTKEGYAFWRVLYNEWIEEDRKRKIDSVKELKTETKEQARELLSILSRKISI